MAKINLHAYEPTTIRIDGTEIAIGVKRLSVTEKARFDRLFSRYVWRESERLLTVRRPGEESEHVTTSALSSERLEAEQAWRAEHLAVDDGNLIIESGDALALAQRYRALVEALQPTDRFLVPMDEIRRRRLIEMSDAERARYEAIRNEDDQAGAQFFTEALGAFIRVKVGEIEVTTEDDVVVPVTTGEQLAQYFGGRDGKATDVIPQLVRAIREENEMSVSEKNASRSRFASEPGSNGRDPKPVGAGPATTAASVETPGTATNAAAMPLAPTSSGPMGSSPSDPVPSSV